MKIEYVEQKPTFALNRRPHDRRSRHGRSGRRREGARLGAEPVVLEKGDRPGGSMLLSSGVIWRYRTVEEFRAECPGGDPDLQA